MNSTSISVVNDCATMENVTLYDVINVHLFPPLLKIRSSQAIRAMCIALAMSLPHFSEACQVPVFRYALERWPADAFRLTLFLSGPADPATDALVKAYEKVSLDQQANIVITTTDVKIPMEENVATIWMEQKDPVTPWLTINYPESDNIATSPWAGRFTPEIARQIVDSPARRTLASRLVAGESAVWILLESGDPAKDAAAENILTTELRKQEKLIEVPPVDPEDPRTEGNADLKIAFSVLRISRADPAEAFFIAQLQGIDSELKNTKEPIIFPVFGRGRVLIGLTGERLTATGVEEACVYLCGACSCEIKAQNPGVDLLMAVNWDESIENRVIKDLPLPPLVSLSTLAAPQAVQPVPTVAPRVQPVSQPVADGTLRRNLLITLAVLVSGAILLTLGYLRRKRP